MLNPFPIQFLAPLAFFLLRVTLGILCVRLGLRMLRAEHTSVKRRLLGTLFLGTGSFLVLGLYTQIAALGAILLSIVGLARKGVLPGLTRTSLFLMIAISLSLFITGGGPFGFDLPI